MACSNRATRSSWEWCQGALEVLRLKGIVTADEVPDPQSLDMTLDVNGTRMQTGNTATMIFSVAEIIAHLSELMTLHPGDVISTGTPPGVGMGKKPDPVFLQEGDVMELWIDGLGRQRQMVGRDPV